MLRLQHKSVRNRLNLWVKLGFFSLVGHIAVLGLLFFVYQGSMPDLALTVRAAQLNSTIDVVWVKNLPGGRSAVGKKGGVKKAAPVAARKSKIEAKKSGPKTELKSEVEEKKNTKKSVPQSTRDERGKKKLEVKKQIEEKKKEEAKKLEQEKKKEPLKEPDPIDPPSVRPESIEGPINSSIETQIADQTDQDLNFEISGSYRELEALQQFQELQQEISRCWRPPVGIAQTVTCQIAVTFDWEGKLVNMETVKPSGVLMFDVSSRNAVAAMEAPKFVRGKTFTITFKP